MQHQVALLWYRNDLRLHDHEALHQALRQAKQVVPVYCIDPRHFHATRWGFPKTGPFRARFLLESLTTLRHRLQQKGSDLIIRWGKPEETLPEIAKTYEATAVFAHQEVTSEELKVEQRLESRLFPLGISMEWYWGATLFHLNDLPMPVASLPEIFTHFRKEVERNAEVRDCFPTPQNIPSPAFSDTGELPSVGELGLKEVEADARGVLPFLGGEIAALERLQTYFWEENRLKDYKETRNGLLGSGYSSKFSPWLALGCLSPRQIYQEVKRYEALRISNRSTYWLVFELIWRDFFRFICKKHGDAVFHSGGIKDAPRRLHFNESRFKAWREGQTGIPFIDANMRELLLTGFMSNRGRQNVASFLVNDLQQDWRAGAAWFESQLIDYDVCSNWGNWNYVAGVGNDPREGRYFNVISQAKRYDVRGDYVRHWLPELEALPSSLIHEPYTASHELGAYGISLGSHYPYPVVDFRKRLSKSR